MASALGENPFCRSAGRPSGSKLVLDIAEDFNPIALSNRFFAGGALANLISLASGAGNWGHRADWRQMLAQSSGQANLAERNWRMVADMLRVYALAVVMIPAAIISILIAVMLGQYA